MLDWNAAHHKPRANPLPAVVRLKYAVSPNHADNDKFYGLNIIEKFDDEQMKRHMYRDPVQLGLRIIINRSLVNVFTFRYEEDTNTAHFPHHHEQMLRTFIDIVNDEFKYFFSEMMIRLEQMEKAGDKESHRVLYSELGMLQNARKTIKMGNIAKLLLKCTDTFRAKKNWYSHRASVGSSICQLASILSQMKKASVNDLDENFNVTIPQGNKQGGSKHSNYNICYTEYMCSIVEQRVLGNMETYFNLDTFRKEKHCEVVKQLFTETVPGYPDAPAPRPTRAHTFDFNCTHEGACLLDGECKASTSNAEIAFMVLHSQEQLVTQDVAVSMLTTSHQISFYRTVKKKNSGRLKTTVCKTNTYELGHVKDKDIDSYSDEEHIQKPPTCRFACQCQQDCIPVVVEECDACIIRLWQSLCSKPRLFIKAVMDSVDILAEHFGSLNLIDVRRKHNNAFNKGWKEPEYRTTTVRDLQTKREILNPERFLYCQATINPEWTPCEFEDKFHEDLIKQYRRAMNEPGISQGSKEIFEEMINIHKRCKTTK